MTTIRKLMSLEEMKSRWAVMTLWSGRGLLRCPDCLEEYPVLYLNAEHSPEGRCRACFCKKMLAETEAKS